MYGVIIAVLIGAGIRRDPTCSVRYHDGILVKHCWERLGSWDPRPAPWEWGHEVYIETPEYGHYATERKPEAR